MAVEAEMDAVFKSSRADKDPVSGNEVPTGSLPEEVRDDIPAQLSEGEYVVPADVVRYYGVKFFEDLRMEAKAGWNSMEENGRIGGEPVGMEMGDDELPFDLAELQFSDDGQEQPEMNAGGYMRAYAPGGYQPNAGFGAKYGDATVEIREYKNAEGTTIYIQFIGETPLTVIPEGYEPAETASEQVATQLAVQTVGSDSGDDDTPKTDKPEAINWKTAEVEDFNNYLSQKDSTINKVVKTGAALLGGAPMYGFMKMATKMEDKRMRKGLEEQIATLKDDDPKKKQLQSILDSINEKTKENEEQTLVEKSGIFGGESGLTENLVDSTGDDKSSFADTWLGDLLGFDGEGGVQGPSLAASRAGARRGRAYEPAINDNDGTNESDNSSAVFAPAATGTTTITNSDGGTSNVTTYDPDKVKEIGYNPGGRQYRPRSDNHITIRLPSFGWPQHKE